MTFSSKENEFLVELIKSTLTDYKISKIDKTLDYNKILRLANKQQIYCMLMPKMVELNLLSENELKEWKNYNLSELKRTIEINNERSNICNQLNDNKIKYAFLKGLEIREYYPKSQMRQMTDNDILYDEKDRATLLKIMKENGFFLHCAAGCSDDFLKGDCGIEFHHDLFNEKDELGFHLNLWDNAIKSKDSYRYIISREDNFLYTIMHMYKHYVIEGCGIRFLCDIYVLKYSNDKLDFNYINEKIAEFKLTDFYNIVIGLVDSIFNDKEITDAEQEMLDILMECSIYGKQISKNEILENNGGKFGYIKKRLFPPKDIMKDNYKILNKLPFLLPCMYIYRVFERLINNNKKVKQEIKILK